MTDCGSTRKSGLLEMQVPSLSWAALHSPTHQAASRKCGGLQAFPGQKLSLSHSSYTLWRLPAKQGSAQALPAQLGVCTAADPSTSRCTPTNAGATQALAALHSSAWLPPMPAPSAPLLRTLPPARRAMVSASTLTPLSMSSGEANSSGRCE
jgi:hypothetical protein